MIRYVIIAFVLLLAGCGGLDPTELPEPATVSGTITYVGGPAAWPDSIEEVRVVLFDTQPLAPDSVLSAILNNRAAFTDSLPRFVASTPYSMTISETPHTYNYVVVAGRTGPNLLTDWTMLALYASEASPTTPLSLELTEGAIVNVNFVVDFQHLPPQPFQ